MNPRTVKHAALGLAFLATSALAAHTAPPIAHAAGSTPSITAIADAAAYGVLEVAGVNFSGGDGVQIEVLDASPGAWHAVATASTSGRGTFVKVFPIAVSCAAWAAGQVTLRAVDTSTHETTGSVVQALGTPMSLAQAQMGAAKTPQQVLAAQAAMAAARALMERQAAAC